MMSTAKGRNAEGLDENHIGKYFAINGCVPIPFSAKNKIKYNKREQ